MAVRYQMDTTKGGLAKGRMFWGTLIPQTLNLIGSVKFKQSEGALFQGYDARYWLGNAGVLMALPNKKD